jgi:hypothetical protein
MAVIFDAIVKFDLAFADPRMPEVISFRLYASSMLDAPLGRTNPAQPLKGLDRVCHK